VSIRIQALDPYNNINTSYNNSFTLTTDDVSDSDLISPTLFSSGSYTYSWTPISAQTNKQLTLTCPGLVPLTSATYTVNANTTSKQILAYFNTHQNFDSSKGHTTLASALDPLTLPNLSAGSNYSVTLRAVDNCYNTINDSTTSVSLNSTSATYTVSPTGLVALSSGVRTFNFTPYRAETTKTLNSTDNSTFNNNASSIFDVLAGSPSRLLIVMPQETFVPGTSSASDAASGTPSKQTEGADYPYKVRIYSTDEYFNLINDNITQVSLNPNSAISFVGNSTPTLTGGSANIFIYNNVSNSTFNLTGTYTGGNTYATSAASENFQVLSNLGATTFSIADKTTSSTLITSGTVQVSLGATVATFWCISQDQSTPPTLGTNLKQNCTGNKLTGSANWSAVSPDGIYLSNWNAGPPTKTLYIWLADAANNVYGGTLSASIEYDNSYTGNPLAFTITSATITTSPNLTVNISSGTSDTNAWCFIEKKAGTGAPTGANIPSTLTCQGLDGWRGPSEPTTLTASGTQGSRTVYLYAKDPAGNISAASPTPRTFIYDITSPSTFTISGLSGSTDITVDNYLGSTLPTANWMSAVDGESDVTYSLQVSGAGSCSSSLTESVTTATLSSHSLNKVMTGCTLNSHGSNYDLSITATDQTGHSVSAATYVFIADLQYAASGSFTILGATSTDGIADVIENEYLTSGNFVRAKWAQAPAADLSGFSHYEVKLLNNSNVLLCSSGAIASFAQTQVDLTAGGCALSNNNSYKLKILAYDIAGNSLEAANSPYVFTVSNAVSQFAINKITGGSILAGDSIQTNIVAIKPDFTVDTNYFGSKVLVFGSNAIPGSSQCGLSGIEITPNYHAATGGTYSLIASTATLNFTSGTSTIFMSFKKVENAISVTATSGPITGNINNLNIGPASSYCSRIVDIDGAYGAVNSLLDTVTAPLPTRASFRLGLNSFDHWGNSLGLTSGSWSGASSVLANAPYPTVGSITNIFGIDIGAGTIQVSGSSDIVKFNVTNATSFAYTSASTDTAGNQLVSAGSITHIHTYLISDDTSTTWRTNNSLSWYNESFGTNNRGSRKEFPARAILVSTTSGFNIIDETNHQLFMHFDIASSRAVDSNLGSIQDIEARNGKIYLAMQGASTGGLIIIDFSADMIYHLTANTVYRATTDISTRNNALSWNTDLTYYQTLIHEGIHSLRSTMVGGVEHLAIGTDTHAYILQLGAGNSYLDTFTSTSNPVKQIALKSNSRFYWSENSVGLRTADLTGIIGNSANDSFVATGTYSSNQINNFISSNDIQNLSLIDNHIFVGSQKGLTNLDEGVSSITYSYGGTNRPSQVTQGLIFDSSNSYAYTSSSIGTLAGELSIELWIRPDVDYNSASPTTTLYTRGTGSTAGVYGLSFNKSAANGRLSFWAYNGGPIIESASTQTNWVKGNWYRIAGTISNGSIQLIVGNTNQSAASLGGAFDANDTTLLLGGKAGTEGFTGAIDEFRLSDVPRDFSVIPNTTLAYDANTMALYHFNETAGNTSNFDGSGDVLTLTQAWLGQFTLSGTSHNILSLWADSNGSNNAISVEVTTPLSWVELTNVQNTTPTVSQSQTGFPFSKVQPLHRVNSIQKDLYFIKPTSSQLYFNIFDP
jgi:hypothetical protein